MSNKLGQEVSFSGSLGLKFTRFVPFTSFVGGRRPRFNAWVAGTVEVSGKITAEEAATCRLDPLWADAHRKVLYLGTTGGTISLGPTATVKLSVAGTFTVAQSTRFMYGVAKNDEQPATFYDVAKNLDQDFSLDGEVAVSASAGLSIEVGLLDRIGTEVKAQLFFQGALSAPILSTNPRSCVRVEWGFKIGVNAFLDLFVLRWESPARTFTIAFDVFDKCRPVPGETAGSSHPVITTNVLPDAPVATDYSGVLSTRDGRDGVWSLAASVLPPGLVLSTDGELRGTPVGGVGAWRFTVSFEDANARSTQALVKLTVSPSDGLGGGDLQATLTWNGVADLDLHAVEPSGNEIYYMHPGPSEGGGELDHDSNANCDFVDPEPAENIHWPQGQAETGTYYLYAQTFDDCGATNLDWHLVVRVDGTVIVDQTGADTCDTYQMGLPARVVMEILGHSQISITMNTYSHVDTSLTEVAAQRMSEALWPINE